MNQEDELDDLAGVNDKSYVHIRIQQRNGRKSVTTIAGLPSNLDFERILKSMKKNFCCNGHLINDGDQVVLQLQGDQRKNIAEFMMEEKLVPKDLLKMHGF